MTSLPEELDRLLTTAKRHAVLDRVLTWAGIEVDPPHRPPVWWHVVLATLLAIVGSLLADAALVAIGTHVFPATEGYAHFQFADYAKLTIVGVLIACVGWPIVTRVCAAPQWLFLRLAVVVTVVLLLPDVYIWWKGQSAQAVWVLMAMHVAIAVIAYTLLVYVAPVRSRRGARKAQTQPPEPARN